MKPFLRLKGVCHEAGPVMCVCELEIDFPLRISFIARDGMVKAYAEQCVDGQRMWWPYVNIMSPSSLIVLPA